MFARRSRDGVRRRWVAEMENRSGTSRAVVCWQISLSRRAPGNTGATTTGTSTTDNNHFLREAVTKSLARYSVAGIIITEQTRMSWDIAGKHQECWIDGREGSDTAEIGRWEQKGKKIEIPIFLFVVAPLLETYHGTERDRWPREVHPGWRAASRCCIGSLVEDSFVARVWLSTGQLQVAALCRLPYAVLHSLVLELRLAGHASRRRRRPPTALWSDVRGVRLGAAGRRQRRSSGVAAGSQTTPIRGYRGPRRRGRRPIRSARASRTSCRGTTVISGRCRRVLGRLGVVGRRRGRPVLPPSRQHFAVIANQLHYLSTLENARSNAYRSCPWVWLTCGLGWFWNWSITFVFSGLGWVMGLKKWPATKTFLCCPN